MSTQNWLDVIEEAAAMGVLQIHFSGGEPTVRHIDARQRNGAPIDRASCVAALTRRDGGK